MPIVSVRIPQIGEGLQEARLVAVLKQPGDSVRRDEPIYQMETDKAVMDVESPYEGVLVEWSAPIDSILPIGGEVARMEVAEGVSEEAEPTAAAPEATEVPPTAPSVASGPRNVQIPPRTRAYAKEKGVSESDLASLSAKSGKLMPEDIDAFLAGNTNAAFDEHPVGGKQRLLASRMVRGNQLVVPGTMSVEANWEAVLRLRAAYKDRGGEFQPSAFTMFAYAVAKALAEYPALRSSLIGDTVLRTYKHAALGIAVGLPGDELVTAVIEDADTLDWPTFAGRAWERIRSARDGKDQVSEAVTVTLTNMQNHGLRDAIPVLVPPACGVVFLSEVFNALAQGVHEIKLQKSVNIALTFDHRILNGVGAAQFLNAIKQHVEGIDRLIEQ